MYINSNLGQILLEYLQVKIDAIHEKANNVNFHNQLYIVEYIPIGKSLIIYKMPQNYNNSSHTFSDTTPPFTTFTLSVSMAIPAPVFSSL